MKILVSGSLAYDRIMDFPGKFVDHLLPDKLHILNVCFTVNGLTEKFGGTAGNIAYSLALLGESPLILATAGNDFARYQEWLDKLELPLDGIKLIDEVTTAGAYITTDMADNQITAFHLGAMGYRSDYDFPDVAPDDALAILAPGNLDDMLNYSRKYKELKVPYIFDPGQQLNVCPAGDLAEMITGAEILISNDYELEMIMQATGWDKAELLTKTANIITTLGENGSRVSSRDREVEIPATKADRVLDPTGAGDAYRSGLIKGLVMGRDLADAAGIGATCASYAVEHHGTQEHKFTNEDFWNRHQKNQ